MKEPHSPHDTERLRGLLTRTRPAGRVGAGSGRIGDRKRRDRRRRVIMSSLLALAVAAFIITPQVLNKSRTTNLRNDLANRLASGPTNGHAGPATSCPAGPIALPGGGASAGALRASATTVRLCLGEAGGSVGTARGLPPVDALVLDAASTFFAGVARLPRSSARHCATVLSEPDPYVFLVGYPDGSVERVFVASTCDDVTVDGIRHDATAVLDLFRAAVAAQP